MWGDSADRPPLCIVADGFSGICSAFPRHHGSQWCVYCVIAVNEVYYMYSTQFPPQDSWKVNKGVCLCVFCFCYGLLSRICLLAK